MRSLRTVCVLVVLALAAAPLVLAPGAGAQAAEDPLITDSLTALSGLVSKETCSLKGAGAPVEGDAPPEIPYLFCDDGLPPMGGGSNGIPVPVKYAADADGDDYSALPAPAAQEEVDAADAEEDLQPEEGNRITLDVDITLPPTEKTLAEFDLEADAVSTPKGGHPVIVLMHGCCGGNKTSWEATSVDAARELWHHSNAWWASRGYVVVNYTARGFRNSDERGSTGTTQLDSRRYEINDYQYLVGLLADHDALRRAEGQAPLFDINPSKIGAVGGSYGGAFTWLAATDPTWKSPSSDIPITLAAAVTKYGWTDLVESLIPSGHYKDWEETETGGLKSSIAPTAVADALSANPIGVEKQSVVTGLYGTGNARNGNHTTFPAYLTEAYARLQLGEPYEGDATLEPVFESFLRDRSAYFQEDFWKRVKGGLKLPIYAAGTQTDVLFPAIETLRFHNKLKALNPNYPITLYMGDYQHFTQNKAKEWGDMCGEDHHVCNLDDYRDEDGTLGRKAPSRVHRGAHTRFNRFLNHYLMGTGVRPKSQAIATTTVCPANATDELLADEPGVQYQAPSWRAMSPTLKVIAFEGGGEVTSAGSDRHAPESDPVFRDRQTNKCFTTDSGPPGAGVVQYTSEPFAEPFTMMGMPQLDLEYSAVSGDEYWIAARIYDKGIDGQMTMVTRGVCKVNLISQPDKLCESFQLFGNGWLFEKDHSLVVEISQSDQPFLRRQNEPSTLTIDKASISMPVAKEKFRRDFRF